MAETFKWYFRLYKSEWCEKFWMWLSWRLPKPLVYWASIRLVSHATTGQYGSTVVPELTLMDALDRWLSDEP